jgi:aryl-alcohol dehydrogenase-like predicted oxidoreductase
VRRERSEALIVATKAGKRLQPQVPSGFNRANLTAYVERSILNLEAEALDLLQLHCPPPAVFGMPEVFGILDELVQAGKIRYYGVSVETVAEALAAMANPGVQSVQIIFNLFRPKPAEQVFVTAKEKGVGILARVPLASGLLSGRLRKESTFAEGDHRNFNRRGEAFDVGETFSGVDYATGLAAVEELRALVPEGATLAQLALRWVLMFPEVSATIPGARTAAQAEDNVRAAGLPALTPAAMAQARSVYDRLLRSTIHNRW